jgi:exodeoxyribonuclease VII large subunit
MQQLPLFHSNSLSVADVNRLARLALENDPVLQDVWVGGEVSGVSRPPSGHFYFTLKDASAALRCVMWRDAAARVTLPREGEAIEVHGHISLYEAGGQYQLYADYLQPAGQGELFAEFQRLKTRLEAEGLFDPQRKIPIPRWPERIAVVTSPVGAAWRDVQNVLSRRFPIAEVWLAPASVQGEDAPQQLVAALRRADRAQPDVVLLVRGGGSIEDLWAFNDEQVVRAVAALRAPIVTGVGHETDFTLVDFAADVRAPTPSAAAELASPDRVDLLKTLAADRRRLDQCLGALLREMRGRRRALADRLRAVSPRLRIQNIRQQVDELSRRSETAIRGGITLRRAGLAGLVRVLEGMGPLRVLDRGYALVWRESDGALVRSPRQLPEGSRMRIRLADGSLLARSEGAMKIAGQPDDSRRG